METLNVQDFASILKNVTDLICENCTKLCELDSVVGDGDHGTTIQRGVKAAQEKIDAMAPEQIDKLFATFAMGMVSSMGGASGPIFASLFQGMALSSAGKTSVNSTDFITMLENGLNKIVTLGKAEEGDKTLVDALAPAIRAGQASQEGGGSLTEVLNAIHKGALEGLENTRKMVSKKGRSRYAGERGLGHPDAGALQPPGGRSGCAPEFRHPDTGARHAVCRRQGDH